MKFDIYKLSGVLTVKAGDGGLELEAETASAVGAAAAEAPAAAAPAPMARRRPAHRPRAARIIPVPTDPDECALIESLVEDAPPPVAEGREPYEGTEPPTDAAPGRLWLELEGERWVDEFGHRWRASVAPGAAALTASEAPMPTRLAKTLWERLSGDERAAWIAESPEEAERVLPHRTQNQSTHATPAVLERRTCARLRHRLLPLP